MPYIFRLFNVSPIFLSPQVKRFAIMINKHGRHKLPHDIPNDLRLKI